MIAHGRLVPVAEAGYGRSVSASSTSLLVSPRPDDGRARLGEALRRLAADLALERQKVASLERENARLRRQLERTPQAAGARS